MSEQEQTGGEKVELLFYRQIIPVNPDRHAGTKIGQASNQSFAAATNSVPLAGVEFAEVCKEYPIVFVQTGDGGFSPVAVLGLEGGENLFLDDEAKWKAHYVPAFVRRYPFILGDNPANPSQPLVCIDEACPWLGQEGGEPLFAGKEPSAYMKQVLAFLSDFNAQSQRTASFSRKLRDWGLLKESQAQASTADGRSYNLTGLWVVDEAALAGLEADKLQELFKTGELSWIYFHMASLGNFRWLAERKGSVGGAAASLVH